MSENETKMLDTLAEFEKKATPGEWTARSGTREDRFFEGITVELLGGDRCTILKGNGNFKERSDADEKFVAALRNAFPTLYGLAHRAVEADGESSRLIDEARRLAITEQERRIASESRVRELEKTCETQRAELARWHACNEQEIAALRTAKDLMDVAQRRLEASENVVRELRRKLAEAGVEGSPPPTGNTTIGALLERAQDAEGRLRVAAISAEQIRVLVDEWFRTRGKPIDTLPLENRMRRIQEQLDFLPSRADLVPKPLGATAEGHG